ncbi:MAG: MarR family transcriptional regulator [Clostridia bacterium]|nr:MarR family transcriptional regulator [Clostridia bacterium]
MAEIEDVTLLHALYQCSHRLRANGKYRGQGGLLLELMKRGTITQRALIESTGRSSATLSEQLDSMEKVGYINRSRNLRDRRNVDVSLTPLGTQAAMEVKASREERARRLLRTLDGEEKQQLYLLLNKMMSSWENPASESEAVQR